jgi:aryl-alcohol dehydrogenase-like predicted oxidoreductase
MEQPQYNMFVRERFEKEYAPLYKDFGLGTTVWSPLASGLLTGKYIDGIPEGSRLSLEQYKWLKDRMEQDGWEERIAKVRKLVPLAQELDATLSQLALAWCLKNPNVSTVITGASKPSQVVENLKAMDVVERLTDDVMERIETILDNRPQPDLDWRHFSRD